MTLPLTIHTDTFATAPQLLPEDMATAAAQGFRTVINNRPDGEALDQPTAAAVGAAAAAAGLAYHHLPVVGGAITPEQVEEFKQLLATAQQPVLAFCRSGTRSTVLWRLTLGE